METGYRQTVVTGWGVSLLSLLVLGGLLGPAQARSLAEIRQTQELRVCLAYLRPSSVVATPPGCREDCTFSGPVYEDVVAFAATLGQDIQLKLLRVDWDEQFHNQDGTTEREASYTPALLASGTCDVYPSKLGKNAWRLKKLDFVTMYPNRMMVIVNKARKAQFQTLADLAGRVAGATKDSTQQTWLQEQNSSVYAAHPVHILDMIQDEAIKAVDTGELDFTLAYADAAIWATRRQFKNIVIVFPVGPLEEIGWAFRKEDTDLQAAVQAFFEAQRADPDSALNGVWKKYFGMPLSQFITLITTIK